MSSALTYFADDQAFDGQVSYHYEVRPDRLVNGNITISILDFDKEGPVRNEADISTHSAQAMVVDAIEQMVASLEEGIRPSIELITNNMSEFQNEELFWIKATQTEPTR